MTIGSIIPIYCSLSICWSSQASLATQHPLIGRFAPIRACSTRRARARERIGGSRPKARDLLKGFIEIGEAYARNAEHETRSVRKHMSIESDKVTKQMSAYSDEGLMKIGETASRSKTKKSD